MKHAIPHNTPADPGLPTMPHMCTVCWPRICKRRGIFLVILWLFYESLFDKPNHTHNDIVNQSEASKQSITACLLTFCNQLGALKSELVSS